MACALRTPLRTMSTPSPPDTGWPWPEAPRLALGCMRLSTDPGRDGARSAATLGAAWNGGLRVFDTARAYGLGEDELGHNERLLGQALKARPARVITKGGMRRDGGAWIPDGRARSVRADCEASLAALDGLPIALYLLHAPDPRTPWATSVRGLKALLDAGLVERIGLSNVSRPQLEEALQLAPISAVQVALGLGNDAPLRGGLVELCAQRGICVLAHSPLGGAPRAAKLLRGQALGALAARLGLTPAAAALHGLRSVHPVIVPVVGARSPATASAWAQVAAAPVDAPELSAIYPPLSLPPAAPRPDGAEVVLLMGLQGSGKSDAVAGWVAQGYERLNRDERGGTLRRLHALLDERLGAGALKVVLDNTYLTRAARREVLEVAGRHGARVRCLHFDTPLPQAQVNVVLRMLQRFDRLLTPLELRGARDAFGVTPGPHHRSARQLEPPSADEGFAEVRIVPFSRRDGAPGRAALLAPLELLDAALARPDAPIALFGWKPEASDEALAALAAELKAAHPRVLDVRVCNHPAGPPRCWCRPPLPGLVLELAHRHGLDLRRSALLGRGPAHRALAEAVGARFE